MKLLYVAALPIDFENLDGVPKKIMSQCKALGKTFEIDLVYYHNGKVWLRTLETEETTVLGSGTSKMDVLRLAANAIAHNGYGCMYVRYPKSDYLFLRLLKKAKKQGMRIAMEIPTYPYDMEGHETVKGKVINLLDRIFRNYLHHYVDRIVTYSGDSEIFGVKTINTINGVDFEKVTADSTHIDVENQIDLIAVSAMFRVHGYDRLIEGLRIYYKNGGQRNIVLKLVGKGDAYGIYKQLVDEYDLSDHVVFCGQLFGLDLDEAYKANAVGVNSLAIHRQGLKKESTLKTKEYAAKGLPILSSSYVDAFSERGNELFAMRVSPDEAPVDVDTLVEFVDKIYKNNSVEQIRNQIREDGRNTCDVHITMKGVADFLMSGEI